MFTGIIQAVGSIALIERKGGDACLRINTGALDMCDVQLGDSIAVSGVCLTAIEHSANGFSADVSGETLTCTTLGNLVTGSRVNLEKALTPSSRLGGHLVSGHVDGVGEVVERSAEARSVRFRIQAPAALARYIAGKGSICLDGVSLTVNAIEGALFDINVVLDELISNIYIVEVETGNLIKLTDYENAHVETPFWSPGGNTLAFNAVVDGRMSVFIADISSGEIKPLETGSACCPVWMRK
jgi:riboflavin synthase